MKIALKADNQEAVVEIIKEREMKDNAQETVERIASSLMSRFEPSEWTKQNIMQQTWMAKLVVPDCTFSQYTAAMKNMLKIGRERENS